MVSLAPLELEAAPTASTSAAPAVELSSLTSRSAIEQHLALLTAHESTLDTRLTGLISSRTRLAQQLNALEGLREVVDGIQREEIGRAHV